MEAVIEVADLAEKVCSEASKLEEDLKYEEAYLSAMESSHLFFQALSSCDEEESADFKLCLKERMALHARWCELLRRKAYEPQDQELHSGAKICTNDENEGMHMKERDHNLLVGSLEKRIVKSKGGPGFSEVIGLYHLKKLLKTSIVISSSESWKEEFGKRGMSLDRRHFLLFGLPGTGKSLIVKAYHQEAVGLNLLEISMTDLLSRYVGDGESALNAAFQAATRNSPCILFLDEIDGVFGVGEKRGLNASLITQFLTLSENCIGVQIFAATNKPWDLEPSFRRRFRFLVHIPLPSFTERCDILKLSIKKTGYKIPLKHVGSVSMATCGLSSSDIEKLVAEAIEDIWQPVFDAKCFKKLAQDGKHIWAPCCQTDPAGIKMNFMQIKATDIDPPQLTVVDLERAMKKIKKTVVPTGKMHQESAESEPTLLQKTTKFAQDHAVCGRSGIVKIGPEYNGQFPWESKFCTFKSGKQGVITKAPPFMLDEIGVQTDICIPVDGAITRQRNVWDTCYTVFSAAMSCLICEHPLID